MNASRIRGRRWPAAQATPPAPPVKPSQEPITPEVKRLIVESMLINADVYLALKPLLTFADFSPDATAAGIIFTAVGRLRDANPEATLFAQGVWAEVAQLKGLYQDDFTPDIVQHIRTIIRHAFRDDTRTALSQRANIEHVLQKGRQFAQQLALQRLSNELRPGELLPEDTPKFLQNYLTTVQRAASAGMASADGGQLFPDGWDQQPTAARRPTGNPIFDYFTGHGHAPGWVTVFMAPFGSCKTTLAVHSMVTIAEQLRDIVDGSAEARQRYPDLEGRTPVAFFFTAETPLEELRRRALAAAAQLDLAKLTDAGVLSSLPDTLPDDDPFEQALFRDAISTKAYAPPRTRAVDAIQTLNRFTRWVDMTGCSEGMVHMGTGGVPDIAGYLADATRADPTLLPYVVWIDHASAIVSRMARTQQTPPEHRYHFLRDMPIEIRDTVARRFQTPVVLLHQLTGKANSFGTGATLSHTDASGCASFGEFADFAIVAGAPDKDNQVCVFRCTKHRHQAPQPIRFGQVLGQYGRVLDVSEEYQLQTGRVIHREKARQFGHRPVAMPSFSPQAH